MMKDSMHNRKSVSGFLRNSLQTVSFLILIGSFTAFSQQPRSDEKSLPAMAADVRASYQGQEKKIEDLVHQGIALETKEKEFQQAIDKYLEAKKIADELFESTAMPVFKSHSDNCAVKISNAYYFWAAEIYQDALKSASEADYDNAISKCRKAIEIYPACQEKMEKIIERYSQMKNSAQQQKQLDDAKPTAEELREKRILLRQGEVFYETKQWDKARDKFEQVITLDPWNETAIDYIRRINYKVMEAGKRRFELMRTGRNAQSNWEMVVPLIKHDTSEPQSAENNINKRDSSDRIQTKLKEIIIDKISFEEVTIATAIRYLRQCSKEKDPEKVGVNFVLRGKINEPLKADGEAASDANQNQNNNNNNNNNAEDTEVEPLTMMLDNIPLETVINYICKQANLKYRIDDNAVVIASRDVPLDDVQTKVYPVEQSAITLSEGQSIVDFLKASGIEFEAGASAVYKGYIGRLIMTNTPKEHQKLEKFLSEGSKIDPQVLIQTKFVEIKLNDLEELGFKYTFSRSNANVEYKYADSNSLTPLAATESYTSDKITNVYAVDKSNPDWVKYMSTTEANQKYTNSSDATVYYADAPLQASSESYQVGTDAMLRTYTQARTLEGNADTLPSKDGLATEFSIYNKNGYKLNAKIFALDQADSADVLSCPRITTMHDTTATIKLVSEKYYPEDWDEADYTIMGNNVPVFTGSKPDLGDEKEMGITLEVTPFVDPDNDLIHVIMQPLLRKFTGWDDYSYSVPMKLNSNSEPVNVPNTMIMPKYEQRTVNTSATCSDNGTIVLGGMIRDEVSMVEDKYPVLGDLPLIGRFFQSKGRSSQKYNLLIFLSCRLVNPDGSPLRERENLGLPPFKY